MTLQMTLKATPIRRLDCSGILADRFGSLGPSAIARLPLSVREGGHCSGPCIGDWFVVDGDPASGQMVLRGDCGKCDYLGANHRFGAITVEGNVGQFAAAGMHGGCLVIRGHAGHYLSAGMRGGHLTVTGNVGDYAGGPSRGERLGMRGGTVWILGDVGQACGQRLRRGMIVVEGNAARCLGMDMVAGTIILGGRTGDQLGIGMKRGTLTLMSESPQLLERRFTSALPAFDGAMDLLRRALVDLRGCPGRESVRLCWPEEATWLRSMGDRAAGGQGEVVWIG